MSQAAVRQAFEVAIAALGWEDVTAWENLAFISPEPASAGDPPPPYQRVNILFATPMNNEISRSYAEQGFAQITLVYAADEGWAAPAARADDIRAVFYRGASLDPVDGVTVSINMTPNVLPAYFENGRYCLPVRIPFWAPVTV